MTSSRNPQAGIPSAPPDNQLLRFCTTIYLVLIVLLPWVLATQTPPALLHDWALLFKPLLGLSQLVAIGTPHAYEECVDLGIVWISVIAGTVLFGARYVGRRRMGLVRVGRSFRLGERFVPVLLALMFTFPWIAPTFALHDYSGVKTGPITRLIDNNLLARGFFCATLLIGSVSALLGVVFITFGSRSRETPPDVHR